MHACSEALTLLTHKNQHPHTHTPRAASSSAGTLCCVLKMRAAFSLLRFLSLSASPPPARSASTTDVESFEGRESENTAALLAALSISACAGGKPAPGTGTYMYVYICVRACVRTQCTFLCIRLHTGALHCYLGDDLSGVSEHVVDALCVNHLRGAVLCSRG